ncbi:MAG: hypothetical protein Q7S57_02630 [bacterium]|nr:hypothetical protein [bacterium]
MGNKLFILMQKHKVVLVICIVWLMIQFTLFHFLGVAYGSDSTRYIDAANHLVHERVIPQGMASAYMGYNLFVAIIYSFDLGDSEVVFVQVVLVLISALCLYHITFSLCKNRLAAFCSAILYLCLLDIHTWDFYILTDSFFSSMTIISLYLILRFKNFYQLFYVIPIVLWTAFIRPTGFVLLISLIIYGALYLWNNKRYGILLLLIGLSVLSAPISFHVVDSMANKMGVVDTFLKGEIIWGYSEKSVSVPQNIQINNYFERNSLFEILLFVKNNFIFVIKLAGMKLFYFLLHVKPFYSNAHNLLIVISYFPIYVFAGIGFLSKIDFSKKVLIMSYLLGQTIIVMLTFEDWDGRFLSAIMPLVIIFAAIGLREYLYHFDKIKLVQKSVLS